MRVKHARQSGKLFVNGSVVAKITTVLLSLGYTSQRINPDHRPDLGLLPKEPSPTSHRPSPEPARRAQQHLHLAQGLPNAQAALSQPCSATHVRNQGPGFPRWEHSPTPTRCRTHASQTGSLWLCGVIKPSPCDHLVWRPAARSNSN